jgi:maltose alpha-D-glucosyltransferase/alpha-amylase
VSAPGAENRVSFYQELRDQLPSQLPDYLLKQRWFGSKARGIRSADVVDVVPLPSGQSETFGLLVRVEYERGSAETYVLPMTFKPAVRAPGPGSDSGVLGIHLTEDKDCVLSDALRDDGFLHALLLALEDSRTMQGVTGEVRAMPTSKLSELQSASREVLPAKVLKGEQSNSSVVYGDRFILKIFRQLVEGVNPDLEIGRFLTGKARFQNTPPLAGWLEYRATGLRPATLAILQGFAPNKGNAWEFTLQSLSRFWPEVSQVVNDSAAQASRKITDPPIRTPLSASWHERYSDYLDAVKLLATRTAQLHLALASEPSDPDFAPEPFTESYRQELEASARELTQRNVALWRSKAERLPPEAREDAGKLLAREAEVLNRLHAPLTHRIDSVRTRIHGDYHLGQVLFTGSDFMIIDFEGEPARTLSERRTKRSPLQDVAGMLRSFHYAAHTSLRDYAETKLDAGKNMPGLRALAEEWYALVSSIYLERYLQESRDARYLPRDRSAVSKLLEFHLLEKAIYELGYELNNRPAWVGIPLSGIAVLLDSQDDDLTHSVKEGIVR